MFSMLCPCLCTLSNKPHRCLPQLLEIYALEIQMHTEQKNNKKLKELYQVRGQGRAGLVNAVPAVQPACRRPICSLQQACADTVLL